MRRLFALIALTSLLSSPAALWTVAAGCAKQECCASGLCPMHAASASPQHADQADGQAMDCHQAEKHSNSAPGCVTRASCNHSKLLNLIAPPPSAVLTPSASLETPWQARASRASMENRVVPGFRSLLYQPPRSA